MIFADSRASEINIPNAIRVDGLEGWTGADIVISRLAMPCKSKALLMRHVDEGAILAQIKLGEDLAASVGERLVDSIARMREVTRRIPQHWLVFVGSLGCNAEGSALINGHRTHQSVSYSTIEGALCNWIARGGVYHNVPREDMLTAWANGMDRRLGQFHAQAYKYALSTPDFPDDDPSIHDQALQLPVRVRDARRVLMGFEGLGVERVNRVWDYCGGDFKTCLAFLTDPASASKVEGIGAKIIASIRKQCGLAEGDGYIGWGRDAVDEPVVTRTRTKAEVAADTQLLFPKHNGARR